LNAGRVLSPQLLSLVPKLETRRQKHITSILLNVRYAVIDWNLVSLGTSYGVDRSVVQIDPRQYFPRRAG
jgi:hypothetical protein